MSFGTWFGRSMLNVPLSLEADPSKQVPATKPIVTSKASSSKRPNADRTGESSAKVRKFADIRTQSMKADFQALLNFNQVIK